MVPWTLAPSVARRRAGRAGVLVVVFALVVAGCASGPSPSSPGAPSLAAQSLGPAATSSPSGGAATGPSATSPVEPAPTASPAPSPTLASAIVPGEVDRSSLAVTATYDATLSIAVATGRLDVHVAIEARNDSGAAIDRLELNTVAARLGGIVVGVATVDGRAVAVGVADQTLTVPLGGVLPPGASTRLDLSYRATLRSDLAGSDWLFSRAGGTLALYRWIPWVSRAIAFDRPNFGDPFVTPTSPRVRVSVTTDRPMVLASPGAAPVRRGSTWSFEADDVRDAAVVLAPDFVVTTGTARGVQVRAYTRPGGLSGPTLLAQAIHALTHEADRVGVPYPWPAFSVVQTAGGYGMESPGLIFVPRTVSAVNLPYLVHHETAHQWFYGLVGNDQAAQPFADEAAADLLARTVLGMLRGSQCPTAPLDRSILDYSRACYYETVYIQGADVLDALRRSMGTTRFWTAIHGYLETNRFGLAGTRQLLDTLRAASPVDLLPTLRARFPTLY